MLKNTLFSSASFLIQFCSLPGLTFFTQHYVSKSNQLRGIFCEFILTSFWYSIMWIHHNVSIHSPVVFMSIWFFFFSFFLFYLLLCTWRWRTFLGLLVCICSESILGTLLRVRLLGHRLQHCSTFRDNAKAVFPLASDACFHGRNRSPQPWNGMLMKLNFLCVFFFYERPTYIFCWFFY